MSIQIQSCDHPTDDPRWTCSACLPRLSDVMEVPC